MRRRTRPLGLILLIAAACDAPAQPDEPLLEQPLEACEAAEADLEQLDEPAPRRVSIDTSTRTTPDQCSSYGADPGVTLTNGTAFDGPVVVADLCIGAIPNVLDCSITGDTDPLDLECRFACEAGVVAVPVLASWPPEGTEVRVAWINPCPLEVAP